MRATASRSFPRVSAGVVAIGLGLALVYGNPVSSEEAPPQQVGLKELEQKRLEILQQLSDRAQKLYTTSRVDFNEVVLAQRELAAAQLDYAATKQERIEACDKTIRIAEQSVSIAQSTFESANGTEIAVLRAKAYLLEAQIARAKVEAEK